MTERIGVAGLGRMGHAMAVRLEGEGYSVLGWTRSGAKKEGVRQIDTLAALAAGSDILILSLFDQRAVEDVLGDLTACDLSGKLIVETSTVSPDVIRKAEARIRAQGAAAVDSPVSGGPGMIEAGQAGLYVGGADADVARFRPVAETLAARVLHVGPLGHGAAAKIINNQLLCGFWEALCESIAVGKGLGLSYDTIIDILSNSPGATPAMLGRLDVIREKDESVGFPVSGGAKDVGVIREVARALGVPIPAADAAYQRFTENIEAGIGENDLATVVPRAFQEGR